jgi:hypothetical protein
MGYWGRDVASAMSRSETSVRSNDVERASCLFYEEETEKTWFLLLG